MCRFGLTTFALGCFVFALIAVVMPAPAQATDANVAERIEVNSEHSMVLIKRDKKRFRARVISYSVHDIDLIEGEEPIRRMDWIEFDPSFVSSLFESQMKEKTGKNYMKLGNLLGDLPGAKALAQRAYRFALKLDPALQTDVDAAMAALDAQDKAPGSGVAAIDKVGGKVPVKPEDAKSDKIWGLLNEEESKKVVAELKEWSEQAMKIGGKKLTLTETDYFLFYSDLSAEETAKWTRQLDAMYHRCREMFGVDRGVNIWHGKAVVFVFQDQLSFAVFESSNFNRSPGSAIGLCHNFGDGRVVITFFKQRDDLEFAVVLVHESTHGFVHRYRAMYFVPSWINEGLSEFVADDLVPRNKMIAAKEGYAKAQLDLRKSMGGNFFTTRQIDGWQYGVASLFTRFLLKYDKKGYIALLNAYKDGKSTDEAFEIAFKKTPSEIVELFGKDLRLRVLVP